MLASPGLGWLIDRADARRVALASIVAFAVVCATIALARMSLPLFYVLHVALALAALGTLPASYTRIIVAWFDRNRGLALGLALAGVGLAPVVGIPILSGVIAGGGWRRGYLALAALMLGVALPAVLLLVRSTPSRLGLGKDGDAWGAAALATALPAGPPFAVAVRSRVFILLALVFLVMGVVGAGLSTHLAAALADKGTSPAAVVHVLGRLGVGLVLGRLATGLLLDRVPARAVAAGIMGAAAVGIVLVARGEATEWAILLVGLGFGAEFDFLSYFLSRYLGLAHYGKLYGIVYGLFQLGWAAGAWGVGAAYDRLQSYDLAFAMLAGGAGVAAGLFLLIGRQPETDAGDYTAAA